MYIHTFICIYVCICIFVYTYIQMNLYIYLKLYVYTYIYVYVYTYICIHICIYIYIYIYVHTHTQIYTLIHLTFLPTQSIISVPLQVNRFQKSILLIVQNKHLNPVRWFYSPACNPTHRIMRYWFFESTQFFSISTWSIWSVGNVLYHSYTSSEGACRGGQPLNTFIWFIGAGRLGAL